MDPGRPGGVPLYRTHLSDPTRPQLGEEAKVAIVAGRWRATAAQPPGDRRLIHTDHRSQLPTAEPEVSADEANLRRCKGLRLARNRICERLVECLRTTCLLYTSDAADDP